MSEISDQWSVVREKQKMEAPMNADERRLRRATPFSLTCSECDGGMEIANRRQAERNGWTGITFAPDLPMANYVGCCPDCQPANKKLGG
jgi:hypothetical protein